jgi:hypothetical protein
MARPYEILLRWDPKTGVFSGGHEQFIDEATGQPLPPVPLGTAAHPWPDVLAAINKSLVDDHSAAQTCRELYNDRVSEIENLERDLAAEKEARISIASERNALKSAHADEVRRLNESMDVMGNHIADLSEQLRIAKLPPADQQKLALEAEMAEMESVLAQKKASHAALLDRA